LIDRIDLQVEVSAVAAADLMAQPDGETSAVVALRVAAARERQIARQGMANALLTAGGIDEFCVLDAATTRFAQAAATRLGWSGRGLHRVLKIARTIADLAGSDGITLVHVAEGLQYRRALPQG
jgi:magnesium chelatase family protein